MLPSAAGARLVNNDMMSNELIVEWLLCDIVPVHPRLVPARRSKHA